MWIGRLTKIIGFLEVHIHDTAGPDTIHIWTVECFDFSEFAGLDLVASVLCEEDRDVVAFKLLSAHIKARFAEAGVTAPGVDVVAPEVKGLFTIATVEVVSKVLANLSIVIGGIANANWSRDVVLDVRLHVTDSGLDESTGIGVGVVVGDLVSCEEAEGIRVFGEGIDHGGVPGVEVIIPCWARSDDGGAGRRQICDDIDSSVLQELHTLVVVLVWVDGVGSDRVGAQLGEVGNVSSAGGSIGERIFV